MKFTEENIKYCLLTFDQPMKEHIEFYCKDTLIISGLYLWAKAFRGGFDFPIFRGDLDKYNVLHINMTPRNIPLVSQLLPMIDRNKTLLLMNVDHSVDLWQATFPFPHLFLKTLDEADRIFAVEPAQAEILQDALKREVALIPHPVEVEGLKKLRQTERNQRIGVSIHRYVGNYVLPWYGLNELPSGWVLTSVGVQAKGFMPSMHHLYPEAQPRLGFAELMGLVSTLYAMVESYTIRSVGRLTMECAALGVPVIGADCVYSQRLCFPDLTMNSFRPPVVKKLIKRLIEEPEFYTQCIRSGIEAADKVSLEASKEKMLHFLNEGA